MPGRRWGADVERPTLDQRMCTACPCDALEALKHWRARLKTGRIAVAT
jgi:hypothetical protein